VAFGLTCLTNAWLGLPAARFCDLSVGDGGSSVVDGILCADVEPGIQGCIRPSAMALQMATTISGHLRRQHVLLVNFLDSDEKNTKKIILVLQMLYCTALTSSRLKVSKSNQIGYECLHWP